MRSSSFSLKRQYSQPELTQVLQCLIQSDKDNYLNKQIEEEKKVTLAQRRSFGTYETKNGRTKEPKDIIVAKLKEKINSKIRATKSFDYSIINRQDRAFTSCENIIDDAVPVRKCHRSIIPSSNSDEIMDKKPTLKRRRKDNSNEQLEPEAKKRSAIII